MGHYVIMSHNNRKENMIKDKTFYITYFAKKHKAFITRKAKWTDDCKAWTSQLNKPCMTYYDLDADAYRTAVGNVRIKYEQYIIYRSRAVSPRLFIICCINNNDITLRQKTMGTEREEKMEGIDLMIAIIGAVVILTFYI